MSKEDVLKECTVDGLVVKLPNSKLDRKVYLEVAKSLELIGGKWKGGKIAGFVFPQDPTDLLNQIANGEKRNLKKEFQFFATPEKLADELIELSEIKSSMSILEPSAGQGAIINSIHKIEPNIIVDCCEAMDVNKLFLNKLKNINLLCDDFLELKTISKKKYDRIIANPPFSKNQDIDHISEMYNHLAEGGKLVSIASKHWQFASNKKETKFREWLNNLDHEVIEVDGGSFKESGTMISSVIIVINKN